MTEPVYPGDTTPSGDGLAGLDDEGVDPKWENDFHGLLYLGKLVGSFSWCGHKIAIHTLCIDEELIIAGLTKEWMDTLGATKAYATAVAALCVDSIDGQPMPVPLGETGDGPAGTDQWARERFRYARRWFEPTIDAIFTRHLQLEARVRELLGDLGKESTPGDSTPGPNGSSGSQTAEAS
jgi:hypothetical protein